MIYVLGFAIGAIVGCGVGLVRDQREIRLLRRLNQSLMDGAARRLVNEIKPDLQRALDQVACEQMAQAEARRQHPSAADRAMPEGS